MRKIDANPRCSGLNPFPVHTGVPGKQERKQHATPAFNSVLHTGVPLKVPFSPDVTASPSWGRRAPAVPSQGHCHSDMQAGRRVQGALSGAPEDGCRWPCMGPGLALVDAGDLDGPFGWPGAPVACKV